MQVDPGDPNFPSYIDKNTGKPAQALIDALNFTNLLTVSRPFNQRACYESFESYAANSNINGQGGWFVDPAVPNAAFTVVAGSTMGEVQSLDPQFTGAGFATATKPMTVTVPLTHGMDVTFTVRISATFLANPNAVFFATSSGPHFGDPVAWAIEVDNTGHVTITDNNGSTTIRTLGAPGNYTFNLAFDAAGALTVTFDPFNTAHVDYTGQVIAGVDSSFFVYEPNHSSLGAGVSGIDGIEVRLANAVNPIVTTLLRGGEVSTAFPISAFKSINWSVTGAGFVVGSFATIEVSPDGVNNFVTLYTLNGAVGGFAQRNGDALGNNYMRFRLNLDNHDIDILGATFAFQFALK